MRFRFLLLIVLLASAGLLRAAGGPASANWNRASIPPIKTSIYVGSVTLTTGVFERTGATLTANYTAKVFPWVFWSETGRITITLTDAMLASLARGETTDFTGDAVSHKNRPRKVTGRAYPAGPLAGKIKVRIGVDDTELIFNGTYTFSTAP